MIIPTRNLSPYRLLVFLYLTRLIRGTLLETIDALREGLRNLASDVDLISAKVYW